MSRLRGQGLPQPAAPCPCQAHIHRHSLHWGLCGPLPSLPLQPCSPRPSQGCRPSPTEYGPESVLSGESGRPGKNSSNMAWLKPTGQLQMVQGGTGLPQAQCEGHHLLLLPGRGCSTSSWGLWASGNSRLLKGARNNPSGWVGHIWPSRGSSKDIPGILGFMASPQKSSLSQLFSGRSRRASPESAGAQSWPHVATGSSSFVPCSLPCPASPRSE